MSILDDAARRLPGGQLKGKGPARLLVFECDGAWLDGRARDMPVLEVFIRTTRLPFRTEIRPRSIDHPAGGPLPFEDLFDVDTDNRFLSGLWFDAPARTALVDSLWWRPAPTFDELNRWDEGPRLAGFEVDIAAGEVLLRRTGPYDADQLERGLRAAGVVAARTHRIAAEWHAIARGLGGTTTADRWDTDGGFACVVDRGACTIHIDNVLVLPGEDDEPFLRTRVRARRVAADGDRWALWQPSVPRRYRPRVRADHRLEHARWTGVAADAVRLSARLATLRDLLGDANPDALWTDGDEVALWWPGIVLSPNWLGPAVEVVARLAIDVASPTGPYR